MAEERRGKTQRDPNVKGREPAVAVIVLNYNGWRYTVECLESLGHLEYGNCWVVVVDNGSTDDSVERIRAWARGEIAVESRYVKEPGWRKPIDIVEYEGEPLDEEPAQARAARLVLIRLHENRGFAGGNNVAIRYALRRGADWTWLLNNDTAVAPDSLSEMLSLGESDSKIAVVGCKILYYGRPELIQAAGGGRFYFLLGVSRNYGWRQRAESWSEPFEPHYVSGASMLVRSCAWRNVGKLDETFFFYGEEVDWQLRARRRGWRSIYCPWAVVYHHEKATAGQFVAWAEYECTRSSILLCRRYAPWWLSGATLGSSLRAFRRIWRGEFRKAAAIMMGVAGGLWSRERVGRPSRSRDLTGSEPRAMAAGSGSRKSTC